MFFSKSALIAILPFFLQAVDGQVSGAGKTTRYWDCCKPSCSWTGKVSLAAGATPVKSCDKNDGFLANYDTPSGCNGGSSYMCTNQMPWAVNDNLSYGYAAVSIAGGSEASWCCACYELTFTSGPVAGKKLVVQATNTGGDLGANHFDLAIPGGGLGIFDGCTAQWGVPSLGWGERYGGMTSRSQCDGLSDKLKAGCYWRFDWFQNADNPSVDFKQVTCPAALTSKTGCVRNGEVPTKDEAAAQSSTTSPAAVAAKVQPSSAASSSKASTTAPAPASSTVKTTTTLKASTTAPAPIKPTTTPIVNTTIKTTSVAIATKDVAAVTTISTTTTKKASVCKSRTSAVTTTTTTTTKAAACNSKATVEKWGQCGGIGYTGPTVCSAGSTCVVSNQWYSQCL